MVVRQIVSREKCEEHFPAHVLLVDGMLVTCQTSTKSVGDVVASFLIAGGYNTLQFIQGAS
jgi:hypothetical protein